MFVGIDVSKERLDVCLRPLGEQFIVTRDEPGLAELVKRLLAIRPELVVLRKQRAVTSRSFWRP